MTSMRALHPDVANLARASSTATASADLGKSADAGLEEVGRPRRNSRVAPRANAWIAPALVALPVLVAVLSLFGRHWVPTGDQALESLQVADVGTRHTPLVGVYSRYGWHHPGPLLFWLTAPAYRLFGPNGLLGAVGLINGGSIVAAVVFARRTGGSTLSWLVAAAGAAMTWAETPALLLDPWNPWVVLFPLLAFVMATWAAAEGDRAGLLVAVVTGSFVIQTHVSTLPVVGATAAVCTTFSVAVWLRRERSAPTPGADAEQRSAAPGKTLRRTLVISVAVSIAAWSGPLIQQLDSTQGNLAEIVRFFKHGRSTVGLSSALPAAAKEIGITPPWLGWSEADLIGLPLKGWLPGAVALWSVTGLVALAAWRRRLRPLFLLALTATALVPVTVVAMSRTTDLLFPYVLRWTWPVGALLWVTVAWGLARLWPKAGVAIVVKAVASLLCLAAVGVSAVQAASVQLPKEHDGVVAGRLISDTTRALRSGRRYQLRWSDPRAFGTISIGFAVGLLRHDASLKVAPAYGFLFGAWRAAPDNPKLQTIFLVSESGRGTWHPPQGARRLASSDSLSSSERARERELTARVAREARLPADSIVDTLGSLQRTALIGAGASTDGVDRLRRLQERGERYDVYLLPAGTR